ncbi:hypothetical protein V8D89_001339 [Ganoderma adspersum]
MSKPEPGWERHPGNPDAFTRPLMGTELWFDQSMRLKDGMGQLAIGVQFTTMMHERDVEARLKEAVVRLRFECPLVAATMEHGLHHPEFGSWVYTALPHVAAARAWADATVHCLPDPISPESFVQSTIKKHDIPYILPDGSEQYLRVYLTHPDSTLNAYFLCLHSSHAIIDGRPGLNALSLLLEWMTTTTPDLPGVDELAWGTEHKNLPPGPITATGGPREDWNTKGTELIERFLAASADQARSHGVACKTDPRAMASASSPGKTHRLLLKFTADESAKIARTLKALGFTFSELLDAACILSAFEQNPVPADEAETAFMNRDIVVSLTDRLRLPPSADARKHLVSCLAFMPSRTAYAPLAALPRGRARILAAMRQVKAQYAALLANPCFPHLLAALAPRIAPTRAGGAAMAPGAGESTSAAARTHALTVTNVGRVENYVAPVWPPHPHPHSDGGRAHGGTEAGAGAGAGAVIRVDDVHLAVRWCNPTVHAWSIQGRLAVLLQAADGWDEDVLRDFMRMIAEQIALVMAE